MGSTMKLSPKVEGLRGWSRDATLADGRVFRIHVAKGKSVRIPYARRGHNIGFHWYAHVYDVEAKQRVCQPFRVDKSRGVRGILKDCGVIEAGVSHA